jgi:hypothetical protein
MAKLMCEMREHDCVVAHRGVKYHFRRLSGDFSQPMLCDVGDPTAVEYILGLGAHFSVADSGEAANPGGPDDEGNDDFGGHVPDEPGPDESGAADEQAEGDDAPPVDQALGNLTLDELRAMFKQRFGREAHPQAKPETLAAKLSSKQ